MKIREVHEGHKLSGSGICCQLHEHLVKIREGVVLQRGRHEASQGQKGDGDGWFDLYVMLSHATRSEDLLLIRAPEADFLLRMTTFFSLPSGIAVVVEAQPSL